MMRGVTEDISSEACGGPNRVSVGPVTEHRVLVLTISVQVYTTGTITSLPVPVVQNTGLPGNWQYVGCLQ